MFIKVEHAGNATGLYKESDLINGKKSFIKDDNTILWNGIKWQILGIEDELLYKSGINDVETPDLVNSWFTPKDDIALIGVTEIKFPDLKVINAGVEKVNDCYRAIGVINNKPSYGLKGIHQIEDAVDIAYSLKNKRWEINGKPDFYNEIIPNYYNAYEDVETPDLVKKWDYGKNGEKPLPVFSVKCLKFLPSSSKAVKRKRG